MTPSNTDISILDKKAAGGTLMIDSKKLKRLFRYIGGQTSPSKGIA
jgi:hypothetical protein